MQLDVYDIIAKTFVNICDTLKANAKSSTICVTAAFGKEQ